RCGDSARLFAVRLGNYRVDLRLIDEVEKCFTNGSDTHYHLLAATPSGDWERVRGTTLLTLLTVSF
ncbi:hypothetical protein J0J19_23340, partial [Vibrio vulnificus]|uniref:hypothetical protein n=1 Tax=Vibrio vulnificus TaxID=672 RepID=UPI0019D45CFB